MENENHIVSKETDIEVIEQSKVKSKKPMFVGISIATVVIICVITIIGIVFYKSANSNANNIVVSTQARFHSLEFSDYYEKSRAFPELEPLLRKYFNYIEKAVERSDGKTLNTFSLPSEFYDVQEEIEAALNKYEEIQSDITVEDSEEARREFLEEWFAVYNNLIIPYTEMNLHISCGALYNKAIEQGLFTTYSNEQKIWLDETEKLLDEIYKHYKDENNKISEDYYFKDHSY